MNIYVEIDEVSVDPRDRAYACRVIEKASRLLDVPEPVVRWYVAEAVAPRHMLTKYGRKLDREEPAPLHGWYRSSPEHISIRADQERIQIGLTAAHELRHLWQKRHGRRITERDAEAFAGRVVSNVKGVHP